MFEKITFTRQDKHSSDTPIDIGWLVECMLFYNKTVVMAEQSILKQLVRYFGIDNLVRLIEAEILEIVYTESRVGIHTQAINNIQYHNSVRFSSPQYTIFDVLNKICTEVTGKTGKGRRTANKIRDKIKTSTDETNKVLLGANSSMLEQDYIDFAAKFIINQKLPSPIDLSNNFFRTEKTPNGIKVTSNFDFQILNHLYHKVIPPSHSSLTPSSILINVLDLEEELYFSSLNLSEMATSEISSTLAKRKFNDIINKSEKSADKISHFQGFVLDEAKDLRGAINSDKVEIDKLMDVLIKSTKFKSWLSKLDSDRNLIKDYHLEVTKESFVDKLPAKSVRFSFFTGLGIASDALITGGLGTAVGISAGALDSFYLDKLISGWKPNQFIEQDVKGLLKK